MNTIQVNISYKYELSIVLMQRVTVPSKTGVWLLHRMLHPVVVHTHWSNPHVSLHSLLMYLLLLLLRILKLVWATKL